MNKKFLKAEGIIPILVVIAIIGLLVAIIIPNLNKSRNEQLLKGTTDDIVSLLTKARTQTLSSYNSMQYGVYLNATSATLFAGSSYVAGNASNTISLFDSSISVATSSLSLNGGGSSILFDRLTGGTNNYGTIVVNVSSNVSRNKTITVTKTGNISSN
ncbi:MAG: type II secretion system protein [bacterium]